MDASTRLDAGAPDAGARDTGPDDAGFDAAAPDSGTADFVRSDAIDAVHWRESRPPPCYFTEYQRCTVRLFAGGLAVRDFDRDGDPDVYFSRMDEADLLLSNNGDGTFTDVREAVGIEPFYLSNGAAFADIDRDGDADLVVGAVGDEGLHLYIQQPDGQFEEQAGLRGLSLGGGEQSTSSICPADINGDGYPELALTEWIALGRTEPSNNGLFLNRGRSAPGHFVDRTTAMGLHFDDIGRDGAFGFTPQLVDLDEDSHLDFLFTADFGASRLFWGTGSGFVDGTEAASVGTDENGMGSAVGDFDGDGLMDWFITSINSAEPCPAIGCEWSQTGNRLYRNLGDRRFEDVTDEAGVRDGSWAWGTAAFDFDLDGDLDIIATNGMHSLGIPDLPFDKDRVRLWRNDGSGHFEDVAEELGLVDDGQGRGLVVFDMDGDGDEDILINNNMEPASLWENRAAEGNHWLRVRAVGSEPGDVRAVVRLWTSRDGSPQLRHQGNGCGFLGQTEGIAHFGLGAATEAARIEVHWPTTGETRTLENVSADQLLIVSPES